MLILRAIQKLVAALNSEGTPAQVAWGIALGTAFGLTPLLNLHNLAIVMAVFLLNVSIPGAMVGWIVATPVGFLFDPLFDRLGTALLIRMPPLDPAWTSLYNLPIVPFSNYNNTVVLGSLVTWLVFVFPIFVAARRGVAVYRARLLPRLLKLKVVRVVKASKLYNMYTWFRPQ